jgi:DNA-binding IclR family transcriptional regulator
MNLGALPMESSTKKKTKENVKVLDKALDILNLIKVADMPLGVNEISRQSSINITTTHRILQTLKDRGWVYQDRNDKYIIGLKVSMVTEKDNFYLALKEIAYLKMIQITMAESEAMNLVVRDNLKFFILQQSRTEKIIDYVPPVGTVLPCYASSGGKVLLSELPDALLNDILNNTAIRPLTKHTITRKPELFTELEVVRKKGFAIDAQESQESGYCIGVPVRNKRGEIIAALSFSGIIGSITEQQIEYYVQILKQASAAITEQLGRFA